MNLLRSVSSGHFADFGMDTITLAGPAHRTEILHHRSTFIVTSDANAAICGARSRSSACRAGVVSAPARL